MSVSAIKKQRPPVSADRQALVDALAAADEAAAQLHNHRNAIDRTRAAQRAAERALETARKGVGLAREQHVQALAAAVADDDVLPASSVRLAKVSVADAEEETTNLKDALLQLRSQTADFEADAHLARATARAAAASVIAPKLQAVLAEARQAWEVLRPLKHVLEQALRLEQFPQQPAVTWQAIVAADRVAKPLESLRAEIDQFLVECSRLGDGGAGPNPFMAALVALEQDPGGAVLPDFVALSASSPPPSAA